MQRSGQESIPVWVVQEKKLSQKSDLPTLQQDMEADVCIIGAGVAGLTTAYLLQKAGKQVVILDAYDIAAGETGRTTAHLSAVLDDHFSRLEKLFGEKGTRLAVESHQAAVDQIEQIIRAENIDCDFERVPGYLVASAPDQMELFNREAEASLRVGFPQREKLAEVPLDGVKIGPTLGFAQQAAFNIVKYMHGLAAALQRRGGKIFINARVKNFEVNGHAYVVTENGRGVSAGALVVATNTPVIDKARIHTKQAAYRSYVIACEIEKNSYPGFLLWDLADPYHYVRLLRGEDRDWLVIGGEDHKTGQANDAGMRYHRLETWARAHFSGLGKVTHRWSGQIMEPVDSLAFIGRNPGDQKNIYIATGDSGHGITHGTIAGMLITDLIMGRDNPWTEIYDPSRLPFRSTGEYLRENVNAFGRFADHLAPGEVSRAEDIRKGEGAIIRRGLAQIAAYRDEKGEVHERSATCMHLGCVVQWNSGEKSWDCPCHGSRYGTDGRVLNGPAMKPLSEAEETAPVFPSGKRGERHV